MTFNLPTLVSSLFLSYFTPSIPTFSIPQDTTVICYQRLEEASAAAKTPEEKEKVTFVKELDAYLRELGLVKGSAFCAYQRESVRKTELIVSKRILLEGKMTSEFYYGSEEEMKKKELEFREKAKEKPNEKYETRLRMNVLSPTSPLTSEVLQYTYSTLIDIFIHERMHDELNLPLEIEEAVCDAAAYHLAMHFFRIRMYRPDFAEEIRLRAEKQTKDAKIITEAHETLQWLYARKEFSEEKKEEFKKKYLAEVREKLANPDVNDAWLDRQIHYHRLFRELYLVPLRMSLATEEILWWYASLPADPKAAEKEVKEWCRQVKCVKE